MDSKRASEVLRHESHWASKTEATACILGAQALEAWAWVARTGELPYYHGDGWAALGKTAAGTWVFGRAATPLAAVLDAMEKEGKG